MMSYKNPSLEQTINFSDISDSEPMGVSESGRHNIIRVFNTQLRLGLHSGAQLVVLRDGRVILDLSAGFTDRHSKTAIKPDTQFLAFSLTKPFTSSCIFKFIEDGLLGLEDPVGLHWPQFSCRGKEEMTIKHVLLHQTGLPSNGLVYQVLNIRNWEKIVHNLAKQKPVFKPGTRTAYQLLNYGFILGEVVARVTGEPIDVYLERDFLSPLGLKNTTLKISETNRGEYARLSSRPLDQKVVAWLFNSRRMRGALIPAASLHSTAREIAIFFQMLLNSGKYGGKQLLAPETVELMTSLGHEDFDTTLGRRTSWGYGLFLGGDHLLHPEYADGMGKGSSLDTFGHFGQRNSVVWADKRTGLVVVFLCNRLLSGDQNKLRLQQISDAVWDAIAE